MSGDILSTRFRNRFEDSLSPARQHQAVEALKDYIAELKHGTDEQRRELGVYCEVEDDEVVVQRKLHAALEKSYWQLVMLLRLSRPSRISEAVPYLRILHSHLHDSTLPAHSSLHEIQTMLYLAAALSAPSAPAPAAHGSASLAVPATHLSPYSANTTPGSSLPCTPPSELAHEYPSRDAEALALFTRAFALYDRPSPLPSPQMTPRMPDAALPALSISPASDVSFSPPPSHAHLAGRFSPHGACHGRRGLGPKTELWARAAYASLLQKMGRMFEANNIVDHIRSYIIHHPYALPSEKYHRLLRDIEDTYHITLLDATLGLETDAVLGVGLAGDGDEREIEHVEGDAAASPPDACAEDEGDSIDEDAAAHRPLSPVLSISPPSSEADSDSGSSADSSVVNSPITPSISHFPPDILPPEERPVEANARRDDAERGIRALALEDAVPVRPAKSPEEAGQAAVGVDSDSESSSDSDSGLGLAGAYRRVAYGSM